MWGKINIFQRRVRCIQWRTPIVTDNMVVRKATIRPAESAVAKGPSQ